MQECVKFVLDTQWACNILKPHQNHRSALSLCQTRIHAFALCFDVLGILTERHKEALNKDENAYTFISIMNWIC